MTEVTPLNARTDAILRRLVRRVRRGEREIQEERFAGLRRATEAQRPGPGNDMIACKASATSAGPSVCSNAPSSLRRRSRHKVRRSKSRSDCAPSRWATQVASDCSVQAAA